MVQNIANVNDIKIFVSEVKFKKIRYLIYRINSKTACNRNLADYLACLVFNQNTSQ